MVQETAPHELKEPPKKVGGFSQQALEALAAISSIGAGGVLAWREILSESYGNFTQLDLVDDIKQKFRKDFGPSMATKLESGMDKAKAVDAIVKQNAEYNHAVADRMKKAGFESNTFSGFMNRTKLLNSHEKWKIGLTAGAISAVALGSLFIFTKDLFSAKDKKEPVEPRPESFTKAEETKASQPAAQGHGK